MATIVVSENVTLDGVIQDPTGEEGHRFGGWFSRLGGKDQEAWAKVEFDEAMGAEALLMGRRTYEWLATRWTTRTGAWADRLAALPKYVVSTTIERLDWANSTVLNGEVVPEVSRLKQRLTGEIVVNGSGRLVHTLFEHDLVDEVRLIVFPLVVGAGQRLFGEANDTKRMRLIDSRTVGDGLAMLSYERVGPESFTS
jgi:dihydrofolate reductase